MKKLNFSRVIIALALILTGTLPSLAHDFEVDGIYYKSLAQKKARVTCKGSNYDSYSNEYTGSVVIPATVTYSGTTYSVTEIGDQAFRGCTGLTSITIPNSVISIGGSTFMDCYGLKELRIEDGTDELSLGYNYIYNYHYDHYTGLFYDCPLETLYLGRNLCSTVSYEYNYTPFALNETLTSVIIGNLVTNIIGHAFYGCTGLTEVKISDLSAWCKIDFKNSNSNPLYYANKLKLNGEEIKDLIIPNDITEIKNYTFYNCTNLTSVTIPNSVTNIGSSAFYGCTGLTEVTIPNSVTNIGRDAFVGTPWYNNCYGEIDGLIYIGKVLYAYNGTMPENTSIVIKEGTNSISPCAFEGYTSLASVTIPNSVTCIGYAAFSGCTGLTSVTIPNSMISIDNSVFSGCTGLTSATIPNSVTSIGNSAFYRCIGLTSVTIPNSVTSIGDYAFNGCTGLTSVTIPSSVTEIGTFTFDNCVNLKELNLGSDIRNNYCYFDNLKRINILNSISSINLQYLPQAQEINIEKGDNALVIQYSDFYKSKYYYSFAFKCSKLYLNRNLSGSSGYKSNYSYTSNIFSGIDTLVIGPDVAGVGGYLYKGCSDFKKLYVEKSSNNLILSLPSDCPIDTAIIGRPLTEPLVFKTLKHVTINNNVQLNPGLFADLDSLQSLTLPFAGAGTAQSPSNFGELFGTESNSNMRAVTQFFEDGTNKTYYLPTGLEELVLTEGCEMIPYGGLYNCNMLKTLTLPTTLFMVGEKALYGCAKMTDIYCKGADPAVAYDNSFDGMRLTSCKLHVPYNTSDRYKMSSGWEKFYYIEEEAPLMVSVAKSIENAGVIYGINEYQPGQTAEMEAVAHSGYTFEGWYEGGALLTTDSKYIFTVVDSHNLVASFMPVLDENEVTVTPDAEDVTLSWASVTGASTYTVEIYEDADMIISAGKVTIDQAGQIVPMSSTVTTTIADLVSTSDYYYRVTAFSADNVVLSQFVGSFSTISGIEGVENDSDINYTILPGMLKIEGEGRVLVADMKGVILYNGEVEGDVTLNLEKGVYILKTQSKAYKVAIK